MKIIIPPSDKESFYSELLNPIYHIDEVGKKFIEEDFGDNDDPFNVLKVQAKLIVNKINFFVGANNSGKSRFMRGLSKLGGQQDFFSCNIFYWDLLDEIKEMLENEPKDSYIELIKKINTIRPKHNTKIISNFSKNDNEKLKKGINFLKEFKFNKGINDEYLNSKLVAYIDILEKLYLEINFSKENKIKSKIYIPVLRSLFTDDNLPVRSFGLVIKKLYYPESETITPDINTGLDLWSTLAKIQGTPKKRDLRKFENFLEKYFFDNKKVEILANSETSLISIAINNDDFRSINDIGDGIQSIILLMYPIYTAYKNDCFYIEEPETNLHPAFQKIFIETLLNDEYIKEKRLKFFFTTHSNHFLDLTLLNDDVSFFQFEKIEDNNHLIKTNIKPSNEILDLLGVNNSSVFLANTSIWVEGITDRKYISKLLKLYSEEKKKLYLKEDIDFAFFEYGGNLIQHYLFDDKESNSQFDEIEVREKINSFALSNKIYLLADNDNASSSSKKGQRRIALEEISKNNKNFKYRNTVLKEIENLLPKKIIQDFMSELIKTEKSIDKAIKIRFNREDYKNVGLGDFYMSLFDKKIPKKDMKPFKSDSGTLNNTYKIKLASFVMNKNYSYDDFIFENNELHKLIEELYSFIKK